MIGSIKKGIGEIMTFRERMNKALQNFGESKATELDELLMYAYMLGREEKARERAKVVNERYREQIEAAKACRYSTMAMKVVMAGEGERSYEGVYVHDDDYASEYSVSAGSDIITDENLMR